MAKGKKKRSRSYGGDLAGDLGAAMERLGGGVGGFDGFMQDALSVLATGGIATATSLATSALFNKTPVGAWLGNAQAPVLIGLGTLAAPFVGMLHPLAGLAVGTSLVNMGGHNLVAGLLNLPRMAPPEAIQGLGWGEALALGDGGSEYSVNGIGEGGDEDIENELLGVGLVDASYERSGNKLSLVDAQYEERGSVAGISPRAARARSATAM